MIKPSTYLPLSVATFIFGLACYAYMQSLIIIQSPFAQQTTVSENSVSISKKKIKLYYWHNERWNNEEVDLIWSDNTAQAVAHLINSWLTLLDEEKVMSKKVTLQSIALTPNQQEALISFDRNPFDRKSSTHEKWLLIEGLLRSLRESKISLQGIQFLVHNKPLIDYHLDFSKPWPLEGFLKPAF